MSSWVVLPTQLGRSSADEAAGGSARQLPANRRAGRVDFQSFCQRKVLGVKSARLPAARVREVIVREVGVMGGSQW